MAKFGDLVEIVKVNVKPSGFHQDEKYLGYEHVEPHALRASGFGNTSGISSPKTRFGKDQIIYGRLRPYFRKVIFTGESEGLCSSDFWVFKPKEGVVPRFAFYIAALEEFSEEATASSTGTRMPRASWDVVKNFEVPDFSYEEQRTISAVLGALDDKIESNQRMVELIPDLVSSLIAEILGGSENRKSAPVSSLASFVNGGAYTKGATGTGRMVIRIAELNSGPSGTTVYNDIAVPDDKTARAGDILMSWSGSLDVYRWSRDEAIINQHIFKVIPDGFPDWYVFDRLKAVIGIFQGIAKDKATTMGHIKRGDLDTTLVPVLTQSEVKELDKKCRPLWGKLLLLETEVHRLAALRDTLLPELLSGRITPEQLEAGL